MENVWRTFGASITQKLRRKLTLSSSGDNVSGTTTTGLVDRSLTLPERSRVCLRGRNGIGKTTLARIAMGLDYKDHGSVVRFDDERLGDNLDFRKQRILWERAQLVYQDADTCFDPAQSVFDSLQAVWQVQFPDSAPEYRRRACRLLSEFGMTSRLLDRMTSLLSGGERRRLSIARALAVFGFVAMDEWLSTDDKSRFLILDEPTVGLDHVMQKVVAKILLEAQAERNIAYLVISHDDQFTDEFCTDQILHWN